MSFQSWLQNLRSAWGPKRRNRPNRRGVHRVAPYRPSLEGLEDRRVLAPLAPFEYAVTSPISVTTGDFNGDGKVDLATADFSLNYLPDVSVLQGNGDGTFQAARYYATDATIGGSGSIEAGDFNGDGKLDLVASEAQGDEVGDGLISVLLGNGDGSFQSTGISFTGGRAPLDMAVGDFNGDRNLDVAVSGRGSLDGEVVVMLGAGNGYFSPSDFHPVLGGAAPSVVTADFNRDGKADLAWADLEAGAVNVLQGNGDGTFQAARYYFPAGHAINLAVADLNGDGNFDLVSGNSVLQGNGDGTFWVAQNYLSEAMVGDFNGDGSLDLLVGNSLLPGRGNDAGMFPAGGGVSTLGDFNGDGIWDVASANYLANSVSIRLDDGIWDGPPTPLSPSLKINDVAVTEGNTGNVAASLTITLSAPSTQTITVAYATGNGTATAGSDYQAATGTLTFAPGETSKSIIVMVIGDRLGEPNETFVVNLNSPTNATIDDGQGLGTIVDDEPRISISDVSKSEGKKGTTTIFSFTVTLSSAYDQSVSMSFTTVDGTAKTSDGDYVSKTGTLSFAPGETKKTIIIEVKGDSKKESDETFYLDLFGLSRNALFSKNRGIGKILNDD